MINTVVIHSTDELTVFLERMTDDALHWDDVVLLTDPQCRNTRVVLVSKNSGVVGSFTPTMTGTELWDARRRIHSKWFTIALQKEFSECDGASLLTHESLTVLTKKRMIDVLQKPERPKIKKGRSGSISTQTAMLVYRQSHMRCMYQGCGVRLGENQSSGDTGNFGYLAHIIPASEDGPRGEQAKPRECERLVDAPENLMLLCDKCHRLIDRVAVNAHPVTLLRNMRKDFCDSVEKCLDALQYEVATVAEFVWPIGGKYISPPAGKEIVDCLRVSHLRWDGYRRVVSDQNAGLHDNKTAEFWGSVPMLLQKANQKLSDVIADSKPVVLFALAPMPALVALGALIGSKTNLIVAAKSKKLGCWKWQREYAESELYSVRWKHDDAHAQEAVIQLNFTSETKAQDKKRRELVSARSMIEIVIQAKDLGNDCLAHPEEGQLFEEEMRCLLNSLRSNKGIRKVHLLICASNLVCLHFGKAIEQYSPVIEVYDFVNSPTNEIELQSLIQITPGNQDCSVSTCI